MTAVSDYRTRAGFHPYHLVLIAGAAALFLSGLLSDVAYARTYLVQWLNFAAWQIAGAMVFTGLALAWSLAETILGLGRRREGLIGLVLLLAIFVFGLINSFMHARDAWGAMPGGLLWSLIVTALALAAVWISVSRPHFGARA